MLFKSRSWGNLPQFPRASEYHIRIFGLKMIRVAPTLVPTVNLKNLNADQLISQSNALKGHFLLPSHFRLYAKTAIFNPHQSL